MYQVNLGDKVLYYPASEDACIYDTELNEEIGMAGEFSFKVPLNNPLYSELTQGALITILRDGKEFWRGEINDITTDFAKVAKVYCVEDLAWLGTEFMVPASITTDTFAQRFQTAIDTYNLNRSAERQFQVGYLTNVTSGNLCNWTTEYDWSILDSIRECICNAGSTTGYLRVRRVTSGGTVTRYIDCVKLSDYGVLATQPIEYGYNLLDYVKESDYSNLTNVLTPYGEETDTEVYDGYNQRIQGTVITDAASITVYGRHARAVIFDGVENVADLNTLAAAYLTRYSQPQLTMQVKAVDLAGIESVDAISIGDSVRIIAKPFAVDQWLYLTQIKRDIQNIDKNSITLSGHVVSGRTLTAQAIGTADAVKNLPSKSSILDAARKNALAILEGVDGGYVTFETNADDQIEELRIANHLDFDQATQCWRWNLGGLAYLSRNVASDPWTVVTAATMDGGIVADVVSTGTMNADLIRTGLLTDLNGKFSLDMDTGVLNMQDGTFKGTVNASTISGASKFSMSAMGADSLHNSTLNWGDTWEDSLTVVVTNNNNGGLGVCKNSNRNRAIYMHYDEILWYDNSSTPEFAQFDSSPSDIRLKENIEDVDPEEIKKLFMRIRPIKFKYKNGKDNQYGLIAQELYEVLNDLGWDSCQYVKEYGEDGYYKIEYIKLYRLSMLAMQDLYKRIEKLEAEIEKLKGERNG